MSKHKEPLDKDDMTIRRWLLEQQLELERKQDEDRQKYQDKWEEDLSMYNDSEDEDFYSPGNDG